MLDLLSVLLPEASVQPLTPPQPAPTPVVAQQAIPIPVPAPSIAPPETAAIEGFSASPASPAAAPASVVSGLSAPPNSSLAPVQPQVPKEAGKAASVNGLPASSQASSQEMSSASSNKSSVSEPSVVVVQSDSTPSAANSSAADTAETTGLETVKSETTGATTDSLPAKLQASQRTAPTPVLKANQSAPTTAQPVAASQDEYTTRVNARKQVIEQRLADLVAKDRVAKEAKRRDSVIVSAIDLANQGQFAQARQLLDDPAVPAEVKATVLEKINSLQTETVSQAMSAVTQEEGATAANEASPTKPDSAKPGVSTVAARPRPSYQRVANPDYSRPLRSDQFDLPGPALASRSSQPSGDNQPQSYSTTLISAGTKAVNPPKGYPGNGNLRLLYPLPSPEPITSPYGWRVHPITGERRLHTGTDIGAPEGTPILAAYAGRVATADEMGGYGNAVVIEHNNGSQDTLYGHMSEILVHPGQWVEQGTVIGRVGSTGMSTGPHLHFELRNKVGDDWETLDPGPQLEAAMNALVQAQQTAKKGSASL